MTSTPVPGQDLPSEELALLNGVLHATRKLHEFVETRGSDTNAENEQWSLLVVGLAQLRLTLFDATEPLVDYWRERETTPDFEVARERLLEAAASIDDFGALRSWLAEDVRQCEEFGQRMLDEPELMKIESFVAMMRSQVQTGEAPFADLRTAALDVAACVEALSAAQQQWAMKAGADQQGIPYSEEVRDDGTRVLSFDFTRPRRLPWWRRAIQRNNR